MRSWYRSDDNGGKKKREKAKPSQKKPNKTERKITFF